MIKGGNVDQQAILEAALALEAAQARAKAADQRAEVAEAALLDSSALCREVAAELVERDAELAEAVRKGEAAEAMLAIVLRDVPDDVTRVLHLIAFELNLPATPENVRTLRRRAEVAEAGLEEAIACAKAAIERATGLAELLGLPAEHKEETTR